MPIAKNDDCYLNASQVMARYGDCSHMWIIRRQADAKFPSPVYFGRLRFWKLSELIAWERKQAANVKPPKTKNANRRAA